MACVVELYTALGAPKDTGGRWFLESAGPIDFEAGTCPGPLTPMLGVVAGDLVSAAHDACVDLTGLAAGDYLFRYVVPVGAGYEECEVDCNDCATITITIQEGPADGAPVEYCENDMVSYNLYDLLGNTPSTNGNWACDVPANWTVGQSNDNNGTNDTFKPFSLTAGVYTFTYTVNSDITCTNCVAEVVVTITAADSSGEDGEVFICN